MNSKIKRSDVSLIDEIDVDLSNFSVGIVFGFYFPEWWPLDIIL